jgi:hypothetical protein
MRYGTQLRCPWTMAGDALTESSMPVWACKRRFRRPQDRFIGYTEPGGPAPAPDADILTV